MQKTKIKVRVDLAIHADAREAAWLEVKNRRNNLSDVFDNDGEAKIDSLNMGLIKFGIQT